MEYFLDKHNFSLLKNYILNDPIIDYYNINESKYQRDNRSYYKDLIIKESNDYKNQLIKLIIQKSNLKNLLKRNNKANGV